MARSTKPYPGMGAFVVLTREGKNENGEDIWIVYAGANTEEGAKRRKRELAHFPFGSVKIVPNSGPRPHPTH